MVERHSILKARVAKVVMHGSPVPLTVSPPPTIPKYGWFRNLHGSSPNLEQGWGDGGDDHSMEHESAAVARHPLAWTLTHPALAWLFLILPGITWHGAEV